MKAETVAEARKVLLSERLIFGDDRQIRLLKLDALAGELSSISEEEFPNCSECDGEGTIDDCDRPNCSGHECPDCKGTGNGKPSNLEQISGMTLEQVQDAIATARGAW